MKFSRKSFDVIKVTDIPRQCLLKGVLHQLLGREMLVDVEKSIGEGLYSGDVFEAIQEEFGETSTSLLPSQEVIDQIDNLAKVIRTELVRIIN